MIRFDMTSLPRLRSGLVWALSLAALAGCASTERLTVLKDPDDAQIPVVLFAPGDALERDWQKFDVWQNTTFDLVAEGEDVAIRARAEGASGLLARRVDIDPTTCPILEWQWVIEALPTEADLSSRRSEDMAAALFVAFGDPGIFTNPDPVPTLRYVWSTETNGVDEVVDSPYFSGMIRSLPVRSGPAGIGSVTQERRNILSDYQLAFGELPQDDIEVIALFIDSDHGKDPLEARFLGGRVLCSEAPEEPSIFD